MAFTLNVDVLNPAEVFGALGLITLAGPDTISRWDIDRGLIFENKDEQGLIDAINLLKEAAIESGQDGDNPFYLRFRNHTEKDVFIDLWLLPDKVDKGKRSPSPWKCHAGQQQFNKIFEGLLEYSIDNIIPVISSMTDVLKISTTAGGISSTGFHPMSGWNALSAGASPYAQNIATISYPLTELLAVIGIQTFYPPYKEMNARIPYHLWEDDIPVNLARTVIKNEIPGIRGIWFDFEVKSRNGRYKTFTFAQRRNT